MSTLPNGTSYYILNVPSSDRAVGLKLLGARLGNIPSRAFQ